jgi:hypothetical protein
VTADIETLLVSSMYTQVAGLPAPASDLVARAVHRYRRRVALRRTALSAGALGVAASLAVAATATTTGNWSPGAGPGAAQATSTGGPSGESTPKLRLMAALTATEQTSYRLDQIVTGTYLGRRDVPPIYKRLTAQVDLRRRLLEGTFGLDQGDPLSPVRVVGDDLYVHFPPTAGRSAPWMQKAGGQTALRGLVGSGWNDFTPWDGFSSDASSLLKALRNDGTVRLVRNSGVGAAALDTYSFSYDLRNGDVYAAHRVSGTVTVHRQSQLIDRFEAGTISTGHVEQSTIRWQATITFSDYGVPVNVTAPAGAVDRAPKGIPRRGSAAVSPSPTSS